MSTQVCVEANFCVMRISFSGFFPFIFVPPDASTTSSDSTMPPRAPNSDLIDHTISVSLFGWLLTSTQVLISGLFSFISRLTLFISVSCNISTTQNNTVGVHDTAARLLEIDFIASLHTTYAYLTGLLLTLTGMKYQGSNTDPFSEHPTLMMLFLIAVFVYIIALITLMRSNHMSDLCSKLMHGVCHICGGLACELLLLVLVSPTKSLLINVSSLALIVMLVACYKYVSHLSHEEGTEEQASQIVDLEAAATISSA